MAKSYNLLDYTRDYLYTFEEQPFNEVDSLIFSWISYLHFGASHAIREANNEVTLTPPERRSRAMRQRAERTSAASVRKDGARYQSVFAGNTVTRSIELRDLFCAEEFEGLVRNTHQSEERLQTLTALAASPRFRHVKLYDYRSETDSLEQEEAKQFAAITFGITPELFYVAYRGTDRTFAGWKEDFYMTLEGPIPSQKLAVAYLEEIAVRLPGKILVGGHSKGGNLAVDAAAYCKRSVQDRILSIYSHDGPGFLASDLEYEGFARIRDRIRKTIPQSSMVGLSLQQEADYQIIESNESGINQHEPWTWQVEENHFIYRDKLTADAERTYWKLNNWLEQLSMEDRRKFIDGVFEILEKTGTDNFGDLYGNWQTNIPAAIRAMAGLDDDMQKFLFHTVKQLIKADSKEIKETESEETESGETPAEGEPSGTERGRFRDLLHRTVRGAGIVIDIPHDLIRELPEESEETDGAPDAAADADANADMAADTAEIKAVDSDDAASGDLSAVEDDEQDGISKSAEDSGPGLLDRVLDKVVDKVVDKVLRKQGPADDAE